MSVSETERDRAPKDASRPGGRLSTPPKAHDFRSFFAGLTRARRRALLLDFDGTLAPFEADRRRAAPYAGVRAALVSLSLAPLPTAVWIVSGRTVGDLSQRLHLDRLVDLWGSHGLERRTRHGSWVGPAPDRAASVFLDGVAADLARSGATALLERKLYGLALHGRGADLSTYRNARRTLARATRPAQQLGLRLAPFNGGVELRPSEGHKGLAVERAFAELGNDAVVAYLGDDRTDEDAFEALEGRGLGVLVSPVPRPTRARAWLHPPEGVLGFLAGWNAACRWRA